MLTPESLGHPEKFIRDFASAHQLPLRSPGAVIRETVRYEREEALPPEHPDAWRVIREQGRVNIGRRIRLSPAGLERLRELILEMGTTVDGGRPESWSPEQRVVWCLAPWNVPAAELNEICAVAAAVAEDRAAPERALARHRSGAPLDDSYYRDPSHSRLECAPVADNDRQLVLLRLLTEVVFAKPYDTSAWMVRWVFFRPGRRHCHPHFTTTVMWIRQAIDTLAAEAARKVRDAARQYRDDFFRAIDPHTCPVPDSNFDFWMYGYGEVADPRMEVRVAEQARAFPRKPIDRVRVALTGNAEALNEALREAGTAALRWPWVLLVLDGWRAAIERGIPPDSTRARDLMANVSAALTRIVGKGAIARPDRRELIREAVRLMEDYFRECTGDGISPIPRRLLEIGEWAHREWNERTGTGDRRARYSPLDEGAIVAARQRVTRPHRARPVARQVVAAAFAVEVSTIKRMTKRMIGGDAIS